MMKKLLLILTLFATGCGVNITQKSENTEPPERVSRIKVEFYQRNTTMYTIQKTGYASNPNAAGPKITEEEKVATRAAVETFIRPLAANVETVLTGRLSQRGVQIGNDYILRVFVDEIVVSVQGDNALIKINHRLNLKYSATLQRASDLTVLWRASFRRPNGTTSPEDLQATSIEIAEKVFSEFLGSGWIK